MDDDRGQAVRIMAKLLNTTPAVVGEMYAAEMPSFSLDGRFNRKNLAIVEDTLLNFHQIDSIPDDSALIDEDFLPTQK
jgi:hypothetical protein